MRKGGRDGEHADVHSAFWKRTMDLIKKGREGSQGGLYTPGRLSVGFRLGWGDGNVEEGGKGRSCALKERKL